MMKKIRGARDTFPIIPYAADRYSDGKDGSIRPTLTVSWDKGDRRIVAIGINPSTATNGKSDITMTKLCRIVDMYGFNHVTMLNLFESSSTQQDGINRNTPTDFSKHIKEFREAEAIIIAWGKTTDYKEQRMAAKKVIEQFTDKIYCIGVTDEKTGRKRCPLHPSRVPYSCELLKYSIADI